MLLGLQVEGPARTVLSISPLVWLGKISYGVYLYHWPVYVIVDERRTDLDGAPLVILRLAITLAIAQASYMLVELPIRRGRTVRLPTTFAAAAGVTAAVAIVGFAVLPASAADYWASSDADARAASIEPTAEPLAPVVARRRARPSTAGQSRRKRRRPTRHHRGHGAGRHGSGRRGVVDTVPAEIPTTLAPIPELTARCGSSSPATRRRLRPVADWLPGRRRTRTSPRSRSSPSSDAASSRGGEMMELDDWVDVERRCDEWLDETLPEPASRRSRPMS